MSETSLKPHDDGFRKAFGDLPDFGGELLDAVQADPYNGDPPSRRCDSDIARLLELLNELMEERGNA